MAPAGSGGPLGADEDSAAWWAGLERGAVVVPRCRMCHRAWFPPTPGCPYCGATDWEELTASGAGTLYSWTVVHRTLDPDFAAEVPYTVGLVTLEEGPRVVGRVEGLDPAGLRPGLPLHLAVGRRGDTPTLVFRPAQGSASEREARPPREDQPA